MGDVSAVAPVDRRTPIGDEAPTKCLQSSGARSACQSGWGVICAMWRWCHGAAVSLTD